MDQWVASSDESNEHMVDDEEHDEPPRLPQRHPNKLMYNLNKRERKKKVEADVIIDYPDSSKPQPRPPRLPPAVKLGRLEDRAEANLRVRGHQHQRGRDEQQQRGAHQHGELEQYQQSLYVYQPLPRAQHVRIEHSTPVPKPSVYFHPSTSSSGTLDCRTHPSLRATSTRSSHSSDSSSAYSGSDTMMHSVHSSMEPEPVDLSGLHESVVDSDEDLADSLESLAVRDSVRDCLEKDPSERSNEDLEALLEFSTTLPAFTNMTQATRKALCSVMIFAVVDKAGTVVMNHNEELDSWSVIINGEVRVDEPVRIGDDNGNSAITKYNTRYLRIGDSFGISEPTEEKRYHKGVMRTCVDDCQFVCITQTDYYKILNEESSHQHRIEDSDGNCVLVTERVSSHGSKVLRGRPDRLLQQLLDENCSTDATYVEDFLLTHRAFMESSLEVAERLLQSFHQGQLCDRVTRVLLLWVHNHFTDFETDPEMMSFLERFESALEANKMNGQLRMLNFACAEKARQRTLILTRPSREESLQFKLIGGHERGFGIFVEKVEKGSKAAEIGLKRGDQLLEVNRQSFEQNMGLHKALTLLMESTHLEMIVKSNLLGLRAATDSYDLSAHHPKLSTLSHHGSSSLLQSSSTLLRSALEPHQQQQQHGTILKTTRSTTSLPASSSSKDRVKAVLKGLVMRSSNKGSGYNDGGISNSTSDHLGHLVGTSDNSDNWDSPATNDMPDHSLKVYKSDQHFRYLLVHSNTTAKEVVMLALAEFGISEYSSNYTLCEVSVDNDLVKQKRLPNDLSNLAERMGVASRYYIKNVMSNDQLIADDSAIKIELMKENNVNLLQLNAMEVATQLMVEDFTLFRSIESTEYIDKLFEITSKFGTPNLSLFAELVNTEMMWVITEVVSEPLLSRRVKIVKQLIKIAHHCFKETQNLNAMFAITSGLDHNAVKRLRHTWDKVSPKHCKMLEEMQALMEPTMNFSKYRNLVGNLTPPVIPIYPMVNKDLTFYHLGNETEVEGLVNFEKFRLLAKEIRSLGHMCAGPLDVFSLLERQGSDFPEMMRRMNLKTSTSSNVISVGHIISGAGGTLKRVSHNNGSASNKKTSNVLNAKRMYEEAQMVRRVKKYLSRMPVIKDEDVLLKMSMEIEPPVHATTSNNSSSNTLHLEDNISTNSSSTAGVQRSLSAQNSTASIGSKTSRDRFHSPSPSVASSSASSASLHSTEHLAARHSSNTIGGAKFGARSPEAVRKLMSLSDPSKTRRHQPPKAAASSSSHSGSAMNDYTVMTTASATVVSPTLPERKRERAHERSKSDAWHSARFTIGSNKTSLPNSRALTAESSSVTTLNAGSSSSTRRRPRVDETDFGSSGKIPKARIGGRTLSRERRQRIKSTNSASGVEGDEVTQVSAV